MMKSSIAASFLAFTVVFTPVAALASSNPSTTDTRYFVPTTKSFWVKAFGARNVFPTGFTTNLSGVQLRVARFAGLKPVEVKKFNILAETKEEVLPSQSPTPEPTPVTSVSWGVRYLLGNDEVHKTSGGKGVTVAILDTGVDVSHPDLADRVSDCADFSDSAKAFIDQECTDANGHGTHMAGIVAADGGKDGQGIWGMAPQADILAYKVCNTEGLCLSDDIAMGIRMAVDNGANIIVLGLGGENNSSFIDDALQYAADNDVMVVAAAGNDGPYDDSMDWPARNTLTISVGAINSDSSPAEFSSRGTNEQTKSYQHNSGDIEFAAPGVNIESTFRDGGYAILSGTSMAAPHIAGLAARLWQTKAEHPAHATRAVLHDMAHDILPLGDDAGSGWGVPRF